MNTADREMFNTLSSTATGKQLVDYLKRMQNEICDSRNWVEFETKESSTQASRHIQLLIDKINLKKSDIPVPEINQFE